MIFFVWSLVLSAVHYARKQRLIKILSGYFFSPRHHDTMLLCRHIINFNLRTKFLERGGNALGVGGPRASLCRFSSEPTIAHINECSLLYRNDEVEILVRPRSKQAFQIDDWFIISKPLLSRTPRITFVVTLGPVCLLSPPKGTATGTISADELRQEDDIGSSSTIRNQENDRLTPDETFRSYSQLEALHVDRVGRKIAINRGRHPWTTIYDCDLDEFYNIVFAWSEGVLLDSNGKATVKTIQTIQLPEYLFTSPSNSRNDRGSILVQSSIDSLNRDQRPLTLLEFLYLNESKEDADSTPTTLANACDRFSSKYHSDTTLHISSAIQPYCSYHRVPQLKDYSKDDFIRSREQNPLMGSLHYGMCSPSAFLPLSYSVSEQISSFVKYLKEHSQNGNSNSNLQSRCVSVSASISPSATLPDAKDLEEQSIADDILREEKERDKNCSTITELGNTLSSKQSSHMSSRFTTTAVREEDFAEVSSLDKQQCSLLQSVQPEKNMDDNFSSSEFVADAKEISDAHERNHSKSTVPSVPKQNNISNLEDATQTTATKLLTLIDNQGHKKTVPINLSLAQDYPRSALEILQQRRHSSMLPRLRDDFSLDPSLKSIRRHSLSPITSAFEHPSMHLSRVPIFSPESFRRPSFMPTRRRFHSIAPVEKAQAKPPTILVYTGDNNELFNGIASSLSTMISSDTYTVFHLSKEALRDHPWISNETACLLIADTKTLDDKSWARLQHYFNNSGKMIFICQNSLLASLSSCETSRKSVKMLKMAFGERHTSALGKDFETFLKKTLKMIAKHKKVNETFHAKDLIGGYKYSVVVTKDEETPMLLYMENAAQQASALFSDATSEQLLAGGAGLIADALARLSIPTIHNSQMPHASRGYLICQSDRLPWSMEGMHFNEHFCGSPKVIIRQLKKHGDLPEPSAGLFPIEVRTRDEGLPDFDQKTYFRVLDTERIGKALIYVPVCESTQNIARSLAVGMPKEPVVVIARQQTKGKGRSGNQWLSPPGCAMFSFNFFIPSNTNLADNVGFIQHILCVAMVDGVCSLHDLKDFPLRIKWPNDIYYGRTYKMGGLLVNASTRDEHIICTLGAGLNVANSKPTVCINDMLPVDSGTEVTVEEFIANTLNKFEFYVNVFQTEGRSAFLKYYYDYWLHSREEVTLAKTNEKVVVRGLDEHGFLEVRSRQSGRVMTVHPDGNTFDMMKGLISVKL